MVFERQEIISRLLCQVTSSTCTSTSEFFDSRINYSQADCQRKYRWQKSIFRHQQQTPASHSQRHSQQRQQEGIVDWCVHNIVTNGTTIWWRSLVSSLVAWFSLSKRVVTWPHSWWRWVFIWIIGWLTLSFRTKLHDRPSGTGFEGSIVQLEDLCGDWTSIWMHPQIFHLAGRPLYVLRSRRYNPKQVCTTTSMYASSNFLFCS